MASDDHNATPGDATARHLTIRGQVQGVGFRWSMCEAANAHDLRGWVRNRRDGSVEAVAIGASPALERLREWTRRGPPGARVDRVIERAATAGEVALAAAGFASLSTC